VEEEEVSTFGPDGNPDINSVRVVGEKIENLIVSDWRLPMFKISWISRVSWMRNRLVPTPQFVKNKCNLCGQCLQICPKQALFINKERVKLNSKDCIHCLCCHEVCSEGAVRLRKGWLGR